MPADRYHYDGRISDSADDSENRYGSPTCYHKGYRVVRFYEDRPGYRRTIIPRCTLGEAQSHCSDPETSSSTAKGASKVRLTRRVGRWFDGYEER